MAATLNISLPEPLKSVIDARTESGEFASADSYVGDLIHEDHERRLSELEARLVQALKDEDHSIVLTADEVNRGGIVNLLQVV